MPKERMIELLRELLKNSKRSDRELARILGASQPTITRTRRKLEKDGYIQQYTAVPDLTKVGYEILAFTFMKIIPHEETSGEAKLTEKTHQWTLENPKIILAMHGDGLNGKNCTILSLHKDFTDYYTFISKFKGKWSSNMRDVDTFLVSLKAKAVKPFSFRRLEIIS